MGRRGEHVYAVIHNKNGEIQQIRIEAGTQGPIGIVERKLKVATQPEGCVVDDATQVLYVGEEDVAIWRFDFDPSGGSEATVVARIDNRTLTADVEGLAIVEDSDRKFLIASSQGDSTYPVYRIEGSNHVYVGRFAIVAGKSATGEDIDGVTGTDGVAAWSGPIGPFPNGAIAVHDDIDTPHRGQQNYKLIDWRDVKKALGLF
jgi:3-phytase